jgi:hypothetical protein
MHCKIWDMLVAIEDKRLIFLEYSRPIMQLIIIYLSAKRLDLICITMLKLS